MRPNYRLSLAAIAIFAVASSARAKSTEQQNPLADVVTTLSQSTDSESASPAFFTEFEPQITAAPATPRALPLAAGEHVLNLTLSPKHGFGRLIGPARGEPVAQRERALQPTACCAGPRQQCPTGSGPDPRSAFARTQVIRSGFVVSQERMSRMMRKRHVDR